MRYARLRTETGLHYVLLEGEEAVRLEGPPWRTTATTTDRCPWREDELSFPVEPSKIVCVGRNYAAHARELGNEAPKEPLLFLKPPSSLIGPGQPILLPREAALVEHEAELGVVIGLRARHVTRGNALAHVFGYTCVCDVTARDLQKKDGQWTRAKGFDTFCPVGPWIETALDPATLRIVCRVNGATRQDGLTAHMVFDVAALIAYVSDVMTLLPGDLLVTGTPEGVSPLAAGDKVEVQIQRAQPVAVEPEPPLGYTGGDEAGGIGTLRVDVSSDP